jgi:hypothetical protein
VLPPEFFAKLRAKGQSEVLRPLPLAEALRSLRAKGAQMSSLLPEDVVH